MKKKIHKLLFALCLFSTTLSALEVEKLGELPEIQFQMGKAGGPGSPSELYVNEVLGKVELIGYPVYVYDENMLRKTDPNSYNTGINSGFGEKVERLKDFYIGCSGYLYISRNGLKVIWDDQVKISGGISFILKKSTGYIIYFVDDNGIPGAAGTDGKIYNKHEAMSYLKEYDPHKYEESRARAVELRVVNDFDNDNALVWGQTYYSTPIILKEYWKPETYLYPNFGYQIQYDTQGNGYMADFDATGTSSDITIVSPQGKHMAVIAIHKSSKILVTHNKNNYFTASTYVGFGGNVYYYVAGDEYTEVFRIRRTWGEPDMYSLTINGYTEDNYGTYVKDTLSKMTKEELRLLRNYLFALYGFDFKSEDLRTYFDRQVWYTVESGKTTTDIQLPVHRQALFELIQNEERKRN